MTAAKGEISDAAALIRQLRNRRILVVAAHPDDAALSIGGLLLRLRGSAYITLLTLFGRSCWTLPSSALAGKNAEVVSATRVLEEQNYAKTLGISVTVLDFDDAGLRGYDMLTERNTSHDEVAWHVRLEAALLMQIQAVRPQTVIGPAAIGGHVDHITTSSLVRRWRTETGGELLFYQDLPYATEESFLMSVPAGVEPTKRVDVSIEAELTSKLRNLNLYSSQIDATIHQSVAEHARRIGNGMAAERLWTTL